MKRAYLFVIVLFFTILFTSCSNVEKNYWENGNLKSELPYENGKLNGTARWYYEDGTIQQEVNYIDDNIEGISIRYNENGGKETVEHYVNNLRQGTATEYSVTRKRVELKTYVRDTLDGPYRKWYLNRQLHISGNFKKGLYHGTWLYYNDGGILNGEGKYEAGSGTQRFWNPDGSLRSRTQYVNNLKHGTEYVYAPDGQLQYTVEYEFGEVVLNSQ